MGLRQILLLASTAACAATAGTAATVLPEGIGVYVDAVVNANTGNLETAFAQTDFYNRPAETSVSATGLLQYEALVGSRYEEFEIRNDASARGSLENGTLGVSGGGSNQRSAGNATARLNDVISFDLTGLDYGTQVDVRFSAAVEGTLQPYDNGAFFEESIVRFALNLFAGTGQGCAPQDIGCPGDRDTGANMLATYSSDRLGVPEGAYDAPAWETELFSNEEVWETVTPELYVANLSLFGGYSYDVSLYADLSGQGRFDFGNTAYLGIDSPVPFTSASGVFLTAAAEPPIAPVPLPAGATLGLTGFGLLALFRRKRRV